MKKDWWKNSIVYQIYPRSFNDSNGDGIGDIKGMTEKLGHIQALGADVIWVSPVYKSPNDDNGYDISDYRDIMDEFGTLYEMEEFINAAHSHGLRVVMDLVVNHSSDEHYWFQESRKSKDNPYRDYYIWKEGKNGGPPNNWQGFFGGSTWELDEQTGEYYLHLFTKKQPDLNWENPKVRKEVQEIVKYWFKMGIDGFRMDVISLISKRPGFADVDTEDFEKVIENVYANGPRIHEFLQELNREAIADYDVMTVGEGPGITLEHGLDYVGADRGELDMIFHFDHMFLDMGIGGKFDPIPYDFVEFKRIFKRWDEKLKDKGWGSIFLDNHDFPRMVSRFGNDKEYRVESAKLLATLLMTMRGTPYIYQGDEIGMTNVAFDSPEDYRDVETLNYFRSLEAEGKDPKDYLHNVHKMGRDNARTPMQWSNKTNGGFSEGEPWIKVNENYKEINAESQMYDAGSVFNYYRTVIGMRHEYQALVFGDFELLEEEHSQLFVYKREGMGQTLLIMLNFSDEPTGYVPQDGKMYKLVISNYIQTMLDFNLQPWEAKVFLAN